MAMGAHIKYVRPWPFWIKNVQADPAPTHLTLLHFVFFVAWGVALGLEGGQRGFHPSAGSDQPAVHPPSSENEHVAV